MGNVSWSLGKASRNGFIMRIDGGTFHSPWGMSTARVATNPATPFLAAAAPEVTEWRAETSSVKGLTFAPRLNPARCRQNMPRAAAIPEDRKRGLTKSILAHLQGTDNLFLALLYGTGMRLTEGQTP